MSIKLSKEKENQVVESIKLYFEENLEIELGDLKSKLLLDYFLKEIGPSIYNHAINDAQKFMTEKIDDLESSCYQLEFMYWKEKDNK